MEVINYGYSIPFLSWPSEYMENNNKSAKVDMEFVRNQVLEWKELGIVKFVEQKPLCVNPLTVASRIKDGT